MTTMMMLHSVLLLATTTLLFLPSSASSTSSTSSSSNRIIGGQPTPSSHHHSYTISLQHYSNHICGGSLILKDVVLTAAHCVVNEDYVMLDVVVGRDNDLLSGGGAAGGGGQYDDSSGGGGGGREQQQQSRSVPVKQRWIHPKYNRTTFEYDFAILLLDHPIHQIIIIDDTSTSNNNNDTSNNSNGDDEQVSSAATQVPIQLVTLNPNNTYPPPGTTSHVLGWGDTTGNKTFTNILQMANVNVITNTECSAATRNNGGTGSSSGSSYKGCIYDSMICTFQEGKDSCQGDSGGPVIVQQEQQHLNGTTATTVDVQIGVVSWGYGCAQMPGVDSRVSMGYDWIQDTACGWSNDTSGSSLCDDDDDSSLVEELQSSTPTYQPSNTAVPTTTSSSTLSKSSAVPTFEAGNRVDPEDQSSSSPTAVAVEGEPSDDDDDIISSLAPTTSSTPYPSSSSSSAAPMIVITNTPTLYLATTRNEDGEEDSNDVSSSSNAPSTFPTWVLPNPSPTNVVIE